MVAARPWRRQKPVEKVLMEPRLGGRWLEISKDGTETPVAWYLFPVVARVIVFQRIVGPLLLGITPDEAAIAAAVPDARRCLGELNRLLGNQSTISQPHRKAASCLRIPLCLSGSGERMRERA
jgi:hypothetical protein